MPTDYNTERKQPKQDNKNRYVNQPQHHGWEELTPQMKSFWSDFSNLAYQKTGRYPKFTSGKRTPEQKVGKAHKTSKHNEGNAVDMSADFAMYNILYNTPDGLNLLNSYNLGVLDETNPEAMTKTGATGPHYHIGTDPGLVSKTKQRYSSYAENGTIDIVGLERDLTQAEFKIYAPAAQQLEEDIAVEIKKEEKKEEKEEKSESRKKVSPNKEKSFFADIKLEQQKQEKYEPFQDTPQTKVQDILSDYSSISSDVQTKLPNIPSLFREITTKDLDKMQEGGRSKKEHLAFLSDPNTKPIYAHNLPKYNYADVSDPNNPFIDYRVQKPQLLKKPVITKYDDDNEEYSFIEKGTDEYRDVFNRGKESLKKDRLQTRADSILDRGYGNKEYIPSQRVLDRVAFQKAHWGEDKMGDTDIIENMIREEIYGDAGGIDSPKEARKATRYNQSAFDIAKSLLLSDDKMQDGGTIQKFQTGNKKRYTPSLNTQQPLVSWSTLQKDYPELYQKITTVDNKGMRSFEDSYINDLANQPYRKTKLPKDFKIESTCLECDWKHNISYEQDAEGNYYRIEEPKEFEAPLDFYEKWQYGTKHYLDNSADNKYQYQYNIQTPAEIETTNSTIQPITKQVPKTQWKQLPNGTWYKDTKAGNKSSVEKNFNITKSKNDINPVQNTVFKDGGEISSSYNFDNIKKNIKLDLKNRSNFFAQNEIKLNNEQYK